jgi:fluoroacetyl-CoA thioesterase
VTQRYVLPQPSYLPFLYDAEVRYEVTERDTAAALGSGDVPVLATPRVIEWMEFSTMQAAAPFLEPGRTTVGTAVRIVHLRASVVGSTVDITVVAPPLSFERLLTFSVLATDHLGRVVADGEIDRMVVDRSTFLSAASEEERGN